MTHVIPLQERGDELIDLEVGKVFSETAAVAGAELREFWREE